MGLPPGVEPGTAPTLGLRLIPPLAEQMQAELTLKCQEGTRYEFRFRLQGA